MNTGGIDEAVSKGGLGGEAGGGEGRQSAVGKKG